MTSTAGELTAPVITTENMAEEQYVRAKTAVWWDIENCQVPKNLDAHTIAQNISSALAKLNYLGPISISAFGDTTRIPLSVQQALNSTGIALNHVPAGAKDASDKKILVNMFCWALDNPAPANFVLISGDRDFSDALHQLRMRRYNVLLAHPQKASAPLVNAARTVWLWTSLSAGGSPLSRSESEQIVSNGTASSSSGLEMSTQEGVSSSQSMDLSSDSRRTFDSKLKGKYVPKLSYQPVLPKGQESKVNNNNNRQQQNTQGKQFKKPHEYFGSSESSVSTSRPPPSLPSVPTSRPPPNPPSVTTSRPPPNFSSVSTSRPPSSLPSSNVNAFPSNVMNNPPQTQNQYSYPPRPGSYPPRQPYPDPSWNNGNSIPNHAQNYYPNGGRPVAPNMRPPYGNGTYGNPNVFRPYRPENLPPANGFYPVHPRNDGPRYPSPLMAAPDISKLNVSQYPSQTQNRFNFSSQVRQEFRPKMESSSSLSSNEQNKVYLPRSSSAPVTHTIPTTSGNNSSTIGVSPSQPPVVTGSESGNGMWGTKEFPPPSEYVQGLIGVIFLALNILKTEKVMPTEHNISDCIQYGDPKHRGTDVKKGLDSAIEHQMITVINLGKVKLYIGKNEVLWNCVNLGENPTEYPKTTWDKIRKFLSSPSGRMAIMATQCRYEAAQVLKKDCLKDLTLGDILQILNITSTTKKWITIHQTGWKPIRINVPPETPKTTRTTEYRPVTEIKPVTETDPTDPVTKTKQVTETGPVTETKPFTETEHTETNPVTETEQVTETNPVTETETIQPVTATETIQTIQTIQTVA